MNKLLIFVLFCFSILFFGCAENTLDISEIQKYNIVDNGKINDTVYIQINPVWDYQGFNNPQDILIGRDQFVYVADTDNDRIVMMNLNGQILGEKSIKKPVAIAQDYLMNLIVCAQFDTVTDNTNRNYSAVFKIDMAGKNGSNGHNLNSASIQRILPKTSYDFSKNDRVYTGAAVFFDNSFIISRKGPSNSNLVDPDNVVLIYKNINNENGDRIDVASGRIPLLTAEGTGLLSANKLSSVTTFNKKNYDVIITLTGNNSFKTQWLQYVTTSDFTGYSNKISPASGELMKINKFLSPEDVTIDNAGNIFVVDAAKDSVYKFNTNGDELQSFGGTEIFKNPCGLAFYNRTLYVADTGNNRILRFVLSTELD